MLILIRFCSILVFLSFISTVQGQQNVSGTVKDSVNGLPLAGATISSGKSVVLSGANGDFTIAAAPNAVLQVTYTGYATKSISISGDTFIEVLLNSDAKEMADVVVVGYGTVKKKDVTGSVTSIKSEDFNKGIINSPEQLLQGKAAGVNVVSASGEPGDVQGITIRGPGGLRTGSTPLFVVDGIPLDNSSTGGGNPLNFINPHDIESLDVLKDASATAIYGSRGANGVIIVTTKKGKRGVTGLTFNASVGSSTIARQIAVFNADEFRKETKAIGATIVDKSGNTDWQKIVTRRAITQDYNLGLNGGTENFNYYASLGLQKQQGILKNNNLDRYSGRFNASQKLLNGKLIIDAGIAASGTDNLRPPIQSIIGMAISNNPTYPAYGANDSIAQYDDISNPLLEYKLQKDITKIYRIIGNISPSYKILPNLTYKLNLGVDISNGTRDIQSLPNAVPFREGRLETYYTINRNTLLENYLTYNLIKNKHNMTLLGGHSYQKIFLQGRSYSINKFPISPVEPIYNPGTGQDLTLANNKPGGYALINELQSFYGRINYGYANRYLATATVRADGSSKFGDNNKYGIFPSFSLGWQVSEEAFMKDGFFDLLKLRAGWGQTGNQEIPSKITKALYTSQVSASTSYPLYGTGSYPAGTIFSRLSNPNLQWEVSSQIDLGVDFAAFNNKLNGTLDYFNKKSSNILLEVIPADPIQPAATTWTNVKDMIISNQGVELDLSFRNQTASGFSYELGGNATYMKNKVSNSPYTVIPSGYASGAGLTSATVNGYVNGQPIGTFYLQEFIGFDDKGLSKYRDVNGDGIANDKDRIAAGTALPTLLYSFHLFTGYKGFDLTINFNGVSGNKIYDNTANANFYKLRLSKGLNTTPEAIAYPEESVNNAAPISTRFLKNGSYLRLNNLSLGYTFNTQKFSATRWMKGLRLTATGQNLLLITKYDGFDPEVNTDKTVNGVLSYGIDYLSYPKARSFILGLNLSL